MFCKIVSDFFSHHFAKYFKLTKFKLLNRVVCKYALQLTE